MKLIRVGVDLAKNVFQIHGVDRTEKRVWRKKLSRTNWLKALLERTEPGCEIGIEACGRAHHWARQLQAHGYVVKLVAPQFVKPYVKCNKNDANGAEAICEAMSRPSMRCAHRLGDDYQGVGLPTQPDSSLTVDERIVARSRVQPALQDKPLMVKRSNRRWQNPKMSVAQKPEKAIGNRRANSPLWSSTMTGAAIRDRIYVSNRT
jgi:hypothetical protein